MKPLQLQTRSIIPARILIVEDEGIIANRISSSLLRLGYEAAGIADSAEEALAKVAELTPGLILMDIHIKGVMDGIETASILLERFDIPVIYLTGLADQETLDRAKKTGAFGFLAKPVRDNTLAAAIEMAIHKHKSDGIRERERLHAERSRYQALIKATSQIVWTTTPSGTPTDAETEWKAFTGQTGTQLRTDALHPDDRPRAAEKWAEAMRTGCAYEIEERVWCGRDGGYCWMLARVVPVLGHDGCIFEWIGACTDISDRKRADHEIKCLNEGLENRVRDRTAALAHATEAMAETTAKYQAVLDAASEVSIVATDTVGIITVFNTGAERMLQFSAKDVIGLRTLTMLHLEAEIRLRSLDLTREMGYSVEGFDVFAEPARRGICDQREWTYVRKDGTRLDVRESVTAVRKPDGSAQGFLSVAIDTTTARILERKLRVNNEELAEQTRRAQEANLAKSNFLAAMSHEIRTPMNAILVCPTCSQNRTSTLSNCSMSRCSGAPGRIYSC